MQIVPNHVAFDSSAGLGNSFLDAFILYEDVVTGKRAKGTCDILAEMLGAGWQIEVEMSSFKSLQQAKGWRIAAGAVSHADLVVFSCHDGDLPSEVWRWAELCLKRPTR